jgi:hypothetical protein
VRSDGDGLSAHQIIVAQTLTNSSSDQAQLAPLLDGIRANLRMNPDQASADAGYCSAANLGTLIRWRIAGYGWHRTAEAWSQRGHGKRRYLFDGTAKNLSATGRA